MADLLQLTPLALHLTGATLFLQDIKTVVNVSEYDQIDLRYYLYTLENPGEAVFTRLTAMTNEEDDDWEPMGSITLPPMSGSTPTSKSMTFPQVVLATMTEAPTPLMRYIRWQIELTSGATAATIQLTGLARRKAL